MCDLKKSGKYKINANLMFLEKLGSRALNIQCRVKFYTNKKF